MTEPILCDKVEVPQTASKELTLARENDVRGIRVAEGDSVVLWHRDWKTNTMAKLVKFGPGCNGIFEIQDQPKTK